MSLRDLASVVLSPTEPLGVDGMVASPAEPEEGSGGLPSSEPESCPLQQPDAPLPVPQPGWPPALAEPASCPPAAATLEPSASPRLAVDLALPAELPLVPSHAGMDGEPEEAVAPAQVALSVTEFGLIGIGDVNPFLAARPACPASGLHSEPLSQ